MLVVQDSEDRTLEVPDPAIGRVLGDKGRHGRVVLVEQDLRVRRTDEDPNRAVVQVDPSRVASGARPDRQADRDLVTLMTGRPGEAHGHFPARLGPGIGPEAELGQEGVAGLAEEGL